MLKGISIIIPTFNEYGFLRPLIHFLVNHPKSKQFEIIVVDGKSTDGTLDSISDFPDVKRIQSEYASRPIQLNLGAAKATHDLLYFVHADVVLPSNFFEELSKAVKQYEIGCFRYRFASDHPLLKINSFFSRMPMLWCRGGDQTLFITRNLFRKLGGFDEHYMVMEDFDLIRRAKPLTRFYIIPAHVIVSARKYQANSYLKVQFANLKAFRMFKRGVNPAIIRAFYKKALQLSNY